MNFLPTKEYLVVVPMKVTGERAYRVMANNEQEAIEHVTNGVAVEVDEDITVKGLKINKAKAMEEVDDTDHCTHCGEAIQSDQGMTAPELGIGVVVCSIECGDAIIYSSDHER